MGAVNSRCRYSIEFSNGDSYYYMFEDKEDAEGFIDKMQKYCLDLVSCGGLDGDAIYRCGLWLHRPIIVPHMCLSYEMVADRLDDECDIVRTGMC